jgi:hypothetical protein
MVFDLDDNHGSFSAQTTVGALVFKPPRLEA